MWKEATGTWEALVAPGKQVGYPAREGEGMLMAIRESDQSILL